tara:strand:- start:3230 stop:3838 length:609 start_codon:yes stop_codon:yes gene_type:complete
MPKPSSFPTLFDEVLQIHISKLKAWGYLEPNRLKNGTLTWSSTRWGGIKQERGSISIRINTYSGRPYVELDYKFGEESRNYKISLVSVPSNLGKGKIWYFLCPSTHKRCRKLYSICGYFLHREAFNGCMYECQTQSKKWREMDKIYGSYFGIDDNYLELHKKHLKKTYAGKPTKKYKRLMKRIQQADSISSYDLENILSRLS